MQLLFKGNCYFVEHLSSYECLQKKCSIYFVKDRHTYVHVVFSY